MNELSTKKQHTKANNNRRILFFALHYLRMIDIALKNFESNCEELRCEIPCECVRAYCFINHLKNHHQKDQKTYLCVIKKHTGEKIL